GSVAYTPAHHFPPTPPPPPIETWDVKFAPGSTTTNAVVYAVSGERTQLGTIYRGELHGTTTATATFSCWHEEQHQCQHSPIPLTCAPVLPNTTDPHLCAIDGAGYDSFRTLYSIY